MSSITRIGQALQIKLEGSQNAGPLSRVAQGYSSNLFLYKSTKIIKNLRNT